MIDKRDKIAVIKLLNVGSGASISRSGSVTINGIYCGRITKDRSVYDDRENYKGKINQLSGIYDKSGKYVGYGSETGGIYDSNNNYEAHLIDTGLDSFKSKRVIKKDK